MPSQDAGQRGEEEPHCAHGLVGCSEQEGQAWGPRAWTPLAGRLAVAVVPQDGLLPLSQTAPQGWVVTKQPTDFCTCGTLVWTHTLQIQRFKFRTT